MDENKKLKELREWCEEKRATYDRLENEVSSSEGRLYFRSAQHAYWETLDKIDELLEETDGRE